MKMMIKSLALLMLLTTMSCGNAYKKYVTNAYNENVERNTKIAVVPARFELTGPVIDRLEPEELIAYEERESLAIQRAVASKIARKMGDRKKSVNVDLQDIHTTNKLLRDKAVSTHDTYNLSPEQLGEILGVDAVMIVSAYSEQYLNDTEATVVRAVSIMADILTQNPTNVGGVGTGYLEASADIVDVNEGLVLWSKSSERFSRVEKTPTKALQEMSKRIAAVFPYRNQDFID